MQKQEGLAFIKAHSPIEFPGTSEELRTALVSSKEITKESAGSRNTTLRPSSLNAGNSKGNEFGAGTAYLILPIGAQ
jgi:hypothetical protein